MPDPISWSYEWPYLFTALVFGYLLGAIPVGLVSTRLAGLGDVRDIGSGNIGATNVLRTGNKLLALVTLAGDILKGTIAVLVAGRFGPDAAVVAGFGAFLGHLFPVWLKFKGGKGVATFLGVLAGLFWPAALVFAALWLATAALTRYSSLSALVATLATPFVLIYFDRFQASELFFLLVVLIYWAHRENIMRLIRGGESKIGQSKS